MSNIDLRKKARKMRNASVFGKFEVKDKAKFVASLKKLEFPSRKLMTKGSHTEIYKVPGLDKIYDRKNLCLKVFINSRTLWGTDSGEGRGPIVDSTKIQNLMALKGLAPRVYDLVEVFGKTAQVCDFLKGKQKAVPIKDERFTFHDKEIKKDYNFIAGKLVDFQTTSFVDYQGCRRNLLDEANNRSQFPQGGRGIYTSLPYYPGKRDTEKRVKRFKFTDFKGKRVLDIGANIGAIMRKAHDLGAKRVVGLDLPHISEIGAQLAILDGYYNFDFHGADIKTITQKELIKLTGVPKFDIHLFLAMENWVGWPKWVKNCKVLYFEGHGVEREVRVIKK